jgi:hypothetical protein
MNLRSYALKRLSKPYLGRTLHDRHNVCPLLNEVSICLLTESITKATNIYIRLICDKRIFFWLVILIR